MRLSGNDADPSFTSLVGGSRVYDEFYSPEELDRIDTLMSGVTSNSTFGKLDDREYRKCIFYRPSLYATQMIIIHPNGKIDIYFIQFDEFGDPNFKRFDTENQEVEFNDIVKMTIQKLHLLPGTYYGSFSVLDYDLADLEAYQRYHSDYFVSPHYDRMTYFHKGKSICNASPLTFLVMLSEKNWNGGDFNIIENSSVQNEKGEVEAIKVVNTFDFQRNVGILLNKAEHSVNRITAPNGIKRQLLSIFMVRELGSVIVY